MNVHDQVTTAAGIHVTFADVRYLAEDVVDAVVRGLDLRRELADRVGFLSYGLAHVKFISTCNVPEGDHDALLLAVLGAHIRRTLIDIGPEEFNEMEELPQESTRCQVVRFIREGLAEPNPPERLLTYWRALEAVAQETASQTVKQMCPNCRLEFDTHRPATHTEIRNMFKSAGLTAGDANEGRDLRGRLSHGSFMRNWEFESRVENSLAKVEQAAMTSACRFTAIRTLASSNDVTGVPILVFNAVKKSDGDYEISPSRFEIKVAVSRVPDDCHKGAKRTHEIGMPTDPERLRSFIPEFALPP